MAINRLLIANRGEIAVRVLRTAKELGIHTIAIYSELDRDALHVQLADESWNVGPAPAASSYLDQASILRVAAASRADAIHPGYGFLAENAGFAEAVQEAGIIWVGPPPSAIRAMGDKITSRRHAENAGVPMVPGTTDPASSVEEVAALAERFGYPIAIKAAHGGGGKGLRVVEQASDLESGYEGARREADAYFGNPEVYVEKYLPRPRHVEAQILFDQHGNGVFLGERDCTVQRRHQKLIEETPSPGLSPEQRTELGEAALAAGRACGYTNAGTVEFLFDPESGEIFFLEMNTRLQVEHTITEMVTGLDLVEWQLRIADGAKLDLGPIEPEGHAIEFRINAEDPLRGFLPTPGQIVDYREPSGPGVRVDGWVQATSRVSPYYDNLIAKLVVWGKDRDQAIRRGRRALLEYQVTGVATTIPCPPDRSRPSRLCRRQALHPLARGPGQVPRSHSHWRPLPPRGGGVRENRHDGRDRRPSILGYLLGARHGAGDSRAGRSPSVPAQAGQRPRRAAPPMVWSLRRCKGQSSRSMSKPGTRSRPTNRCACSRR